MTLARLMMFLIAAAWLVPASAQDTAKPEHCISLTRIERTDVVDERTILFYMTGRAIYRNSLPLRCPGLVSEDRFMYRVTMNQLCDLDVITVLYDAGFGLVEGPSCGLGKFEPVTPMFAKQLKKDAARRR